MAYIRGKDRTQTWLPQSLDEFVAADHPVRVIDAFVDALDLVGLGFSKAIPAATGRPAYDPRLLLKLYIYGYLNWIRSTRALMQEGGQNLEVMFLLDGLTPNFRTIADFRKANSEVLAGVFRAFTKLCLELDLFQKDLIAIDGTKIRAVNSKDNTYNEAVLIRKLAHVDEQLSHYLAELDAADGQESERVEAEIRQISEQVAALQHRQQTYQGYLATIRQGPDKQLLTTDPDAYRMHTKDGCNCCYNIQAGVDCGSHLIVAYQVSRQNTDQGLLRPVSEACRAALEIKTIQVVADKGYESRRDIFDCLTHGIAPHVVLKYDKQARHFYLPYVPAALTPDQRSSTQPAAIQACFQACVLPDCYQGQGIEVEHQTLDTLSCFRRNPDDTVTCPMGFLLHLVKRKARGGFVYANKDACRQCPNRCTSGQGAKTVYFSAGAEVVAVPMPSRPGQWIQPLPAGTPVHNSLGRSDLATEQVLIRIPLDPAKLKARKCTVEHPFGTIKWYHGAHYLLCRGQAKVSAEIALAFLAYNFKRVLKQKSVPELLQALQSTPIRLALRPKPGQPVETGRLA